jgi:hypothetical protein
MRMTLHCSQREAQDIIKAAKGVDEVLIEDGVCGMNGYIESILHITHILFPGASINTNKITAIKKLREMVSGLGLAESKIAIEQPDKAIEHWLRYKSPLQLY